jgi:hypothetical protein
MADVESNININIDTSAALANIKRLQREISVFHSSMAKGGAAAAATAAQMQQNLINTINASGKFSAQMKNVSTSAETFTNSLEKNKLSMGEYFRYAGASTKRFGSLFKNELDTIDKVARERVKTLQTQYIKLGRDASGAMKSIAVRPLVLDMDNLATKTAIAAQKQQLFNQLVHQGSTNLLNFGKNTQWAGRQLMVGFSIPLGIAGAAAAREFMKMEEQAIRFKRVYGDTFTPTSEADAMVGQIKELASEFTQYGVAVADTLKLAADAAAMGKQGADLIAQVGEANRLAVLGGVTQAQSLETTISLTNAFGISADQLAGKINFLNAVENQTVTSIEDLTEAIPKAGPVIQQLGGNVEDLAYFLTAMREGGINATEGANALKSGLASIINPSKEATDMLNTFGINLQGIVNLDKGNVKQMIIDIGTALNNLDPLNRAKAIETLFGKFQFARMSTLFQNVVKEGSQASRVLDLTRQSAAELAVLSERELKRVSDSPMFKFQKAIEDFQAALAPVGEAFLKMVTPIIEFGKQLLDNFNGWGDGAKNFTMILVGVVAGIGPILLMVFGLIANGVANLMKGFLGLSNFFRRLGGQSTTLGSQTEYMTQAQLEAAAASASLGQVHNQLAQIFTSEASSVEALTAAYNRAVAAQNRFTGSPGGTGKGGAKPKKMARGGVVMVPGSGNGDTVPAMLTPGEAVIPAGMAKKYAPLITGMIAGSIPGYVTGGWVGMDDLTADDYLDPQDKKGTRKRIQKSHLQGELDLNDPNAMAAVRARFPGVDSMSPELRGKTAFSGSLTADLPGKMNQWLRDSSKQKMNPQVFESMWNSVADKLTSTAVSAGVDMTNEAHKDALKKIEAEIGKEASKLASTNGKGYVDDTTLAAATKTVLDKNINSKDKARSKVASGLRSRETVIGDVRGKIGSAELRAMEESGQLTRKGTQIVDPATGISYGEVRQSGSSAGRHKGFKANQIGGYTKQEVMGGTLANPQDVKAAKNAGKKMAESQAKGYIDGLKEEAQTASPSRKTKKIAKDTVDGYIIGLEQGKKKVSQAGRSLVADEKKNTNPAFGAVAQQPRVISAGMQEHLRGQVAKMMPGGAMSASQIVAANIPKLNGDFSILTTNIKNMSNQLKLARSPITMLESAASKTKGSLTRAAGAVKDFTVKTPTMLKDAALKLGESMKKIGMSAKQAATSVAASAQQMAVNATGAVGGWWNGGPETDAEGNKINPGAKGKMGAFMKSGKGAGIGMAASMGLMAASSIEGPVGDVAGAVAGPVGMLSALGPILGMLPGPALAVAAGLAALAAIVIGSKMAFDGAQREAEKFAHATRGGTQALEAMAEASGSVTAGQEMDKRREMAMSGIKPNEEQNATAKKYLEGDAGKATTSSVQKVLSEKGPEAAAATIANQMATAVASGAMSSIDASAVVQQLGDQLGDETFALRAQAQIDALIGPNGEDLSTDPIGVRLKILNDTNKDLQSIAGKVGGFGQDMNEIFTENMFNFSTPLASLNSIANMVSPVASITNMIVGGFQQMAELGTETGAFASNLVIAAQQSQEMLDSLQLEYEKRIDIAKAAGDTAEAERLTTEYQNGRNQILAQSAAMYKQSATAYEGMESNAKTGVIGSLDQQIKDKYKDGPMAAIAQQSIDTIGANTIDGSTAELTLKTVVAGGDVDPQTMTNMINILGEDQVQVAADIVTNFGGADADRIFQYANMMSDPEQASTFTVNMEAKTPEAAAKTLATLDKIAASGGNMDLVLSMSEKGFENLQNDIDSLDDFFGDGKKTALEVNTTFKTRGANLMGKAAEYFNGLSAEEQKVYTTAYLTVKETIDTNTEEGKARIREWVAKKRGGRAASNLSSAQYSEFANQMAEEAGANAAKTQQANTVPVEPSDTGDGGGGGGGGGNAGSSIDDLTKKLRQFQKASIGVGTTWEESMGIIQGQNNGVVQSFQGLEQQLRNVGARQDLISVITGMDPEEYEKRKNDLFVFDNAGNIVGVTEQFNALRNAMNSVALGEFQSKQKSTTQAIGDQFTAVKKLVAAGVSLADAYKIAGDAATAAAIAQTADAATMRELAAATREAEKAQKELAAAQAVAASNQQTVDRAALVAKLQQDKTLTEEQIKAILSNDSLATLYLNPTIDPATLQTALDNAANQTELKFTEGMLTIEGMQGLFQEGMSKVTEAFSAQQKAIELDIKFKKDPFQDIVDGAKNMIEDLQNAPGGMDDLNADLERIASKEQEINKRYQEKSEALDKVSRINDKIIAQQKSQLGLADALSRGDIAAAAAAAQDMRGKQTSDALSEQRQILEANKQFELDSLTGESGLTREQIEQQVRDLKEQILEIEENTLEPAQRRIELLDREQKALIDSMTVLGQTKDYWDSIQASVDLAKVNTEEYVTAINNAVLAQQGLLAGYGENSAPVVGVAPTPTTGGLGSMIATSLGVSLQGSQPYMSGSNPGISKHLEEILAAMIAIKNSPMFSIQSAGPRFGITDGANIAMGEVQKAAKELQKIGDSMYNNTYSINIDVKSDANPDDIATAVMRKIKDVDNQRIRSNKF